MERNRIIKKIAMIKPIRAILDLFIKREQHDSLAEPVESGQDVKIDWPDGMKKPYIGLIKDEYPNVGDYSICYWEKYRKFLKHNRFKYEFVEVDRSDWIDRVKKFDIIVWHPFSDPATLENAKSKIYFMEEHLGIKCYPPYRDLWYYEDKVRLAYLLELHNLPLADTFITNNKEEALDFIKKAKYPLVSKIRTGAGSRGVELVTNRKNAEKIVNAIFDGGRQTYWSYIKQKGYVYFQEYIPDMDYDLRVISVGNRFEGYYKMTPDKDFRASGSGIIKKKAIPEEALELARKVKESFGANTIAVDMLCSDHKKKYKIIETSIFFQIRTARQLIVDGVSGYYEYADGKYTFRKGNIWTQESSLEEVMKEWISENE